MTRTLCACLLGAMALLWTGPLRAGHSQLGCGDCHISHSRDGSGGGLWVSRNATESLPTFTVYSSPKFDALRTDISQPDGASRQCLGCHDGSYEGLQGSAGARARFGPRDLARSHPVSFTYDSSLASRVPNNGLHDPTVRSSGLGGTIATDLLDEQGKLQCTSCHDMHTGGIGPNRLRFEYDRTTGNSTLCLVCHNR